MIGLGGAQNGHHAPIRTDLADLLRQEEIKLVQRVFLTADLTPRREVLGDQRSEHDVTAVEAQR